ncbi:MAG: hypothetical protein HQM10_21885 [Candidatus Riflebacteria bacterium]|nr:hypothetical protein [Candidatus Riflebacteria bacterium]
MKQPNYFLVMNPSSRSFRSRYIWPEIFQRFRKEKISFDFAVTQGAGDASMLACKAAESGFDAVVAVGGDGTINEVINGLFEASAASSAAAFGVIYAGTSPDFCGFHKIPVETGKALDTLLAGRRKLVDICRITHSLEKGGAPVSRVFSCSANFGLGAAVARGANSGLRKKWGDLFGTLFSLLTAIWNYKACTFKVKVSNPSATEGEEFCYNNVFNIFTGKNPLVASGIKLKMDISFDDGKMYLVPLHGISKKKLLRILPDVYSGTITEIFRPVFASEFEISCDGEASEVEYDGDPQGYLPAVIKILPKALNLIV